MVRDASESQLGANLPTEFVENFWRKAAPDGTANKLVVKAMADLWLEIPDAIRREKLYPCKDDKPLLAIVREALREVFNAINDDVLSEGAAALKASLSTDRSGD